MDRQINFKLVGAAEIIKEDLSVPLRGYINSCRGPRCVWPFSEHKNPRHSGTGNPISSFIPLNPVRAAYSFKTGMPHKEKQEHRQSIIYIFL